MAVTIEILNQIYDTECEEYNAAMELKSMLEKSFDPNTNGVINIAYSLTLSGQELRDLDIFVFGKLKNYILSNYYTNSIHYAKKNLSVENFCIAIELKTHNAGAIIYKDTHIYVKYNNQWKDATAQNEKQRYTCANFFENAIQKKIFCSNFLWLKGLNLEELKEKIGRNEVGALPREYNFRDMVDMMICQGIKPYYEQNGGYYRLYSNQDSSIIDDIKRNIFVEKKVQGLTKRKIEILNQQLITKELEKLTLENSLTIFKGRAGTGKTFRLIQTALYLANPNTQKRCILLTYNHALVGDIRRLLNFMKIPDGIDNYTVQILTLHSFFIQLMELLGIKTDSIKQGGFNEINYKSCLLELLKYVQKALSKEDIKYLKDNNELAIDWDYILIDEAQDWLEAEKNILYAIYGPQRIIVADGIDQFMRSSYHLKWNVDKTDKIIEKKEGLRQKANLVDFVNSIASAMNLNWSVEPNQRWAGGEVQVYRNYGIKLHKKMIEKCKEADCENYDILFLIPYQMKPTAEREIDGLRKIDLQLWENNGIKLFDGTNASLRRQYATDVDECRLYLYESCRGLEGWITVCLNFDVLIENKYKEFRSMDFSDDLVLESKEKALKKFVSLWVLMPLTRPIDTLIITLKDPNSEIGKIIKRLSEKNDYITWEINDD